MLSTKKMHLCELYNSLSDNILLSYTVTLTHKLQDLDKWVLTFLVRIKCYMPSLLSNNKILHVSLSHMNSDVIALILCTFINKQLNSKVTILLLH